MTVTHAVQSMAMDFVLAVEGDVAPASVETVMGYVHADLRWADEVFSTYREDSWVSRISRGEAAVADAPPAVAEVLDLCERFRDETDGAFDARTPEGGVDPTGVVKTWAMERVRWRLGLLGAPGVLWGCAGDVVVSGRGPVEGGWRIGIADPREPAGTATVVTTTTLDAHQPALATSGIAHRPGHVWDPRTAEPAQHFAQVSVRGADLIECDAWATAIVAGGERTLKLAVERGFDVLVLRIQDDRVHARPSRDWDRSQR